MDEGGLELLGGFGFRDEDGGRSYGFGWVRMEEMIWFSMVLGAEGNKS